MTKVIWFRAKAKAQLRKPVFLIEVTPVIMLHTMSGRTIIFSRFKNRSPKSPIRLMT
jgi:hypothetical protein